jgi:quercetin dioxygenase-like cupin family protein
MNPQVKKNFDHPDETRPIKKGKVEVLNMGPGLPVMRATFEPGWKWSECVKPVAKTESCQVPHLVYVVSGRIAIQMDDGQTVEYGPGDVGLIPPGHDAWVLGNEPFVNIDYQGGALYAKPAQK